MRVRGVAAALLACALGCQAPVTELVVVIDTDFSVPAELDAVEIFVVAPDGTDQSVIVPLASTPLPITLGLVYRGGATTPVRVEARGRLLGAVVVHREIVTGFVRGETREVRLDLLRSCAGDPCGAETTCSLAGCVPVVVAPSDLPPFDGMPTRTDVGVADGGDLDADHVDVGSLDAGPEGDACVALGAESCDGVDQDCDGTIDERVCVCMPECRLENATAICTALRTCAIASCNVGFANCDGMPETGCERSTRTEADCGGCDRPCTSFAGTTSCTDGTCRILTCTDVNTRDCDGILSNGCEVRITNDNANCGMCGRVCGGGTRCRMGTCS